MSTHNIPFSISKKKFILNYSKSAAIWVFSRGLKNEFEKAVVNEPSVFEPPELYCIYVHFLSVSLCSTIRLTI